MDTTADIVAVDNLVKRYGELVAVDRLSLHIKKGEVFGLLGPNGSGKTTTMSCILQLLTYDKGDIALFGESMCASLLAYAVVATACGFFLGQLAVSENAANAIANIGGMILSFFGGACRWPALPDCPRDWV